MRFEDGLIHLTDEEQRAADCDSPLTIDELDITTRLGRIGDKIRDLEIDRADDNVINDERAAILPEALRLNKKRQLLITMHDQMIYAGVVKLEPEQSN